MFDNAHGCATDAVSIRRNAFLAIFKSIESIFLNFKKLNFSPQKLVLYLAFPMKLKSRWSIEYNTLKYRLEKWQFNIASYGTHSVLDTPDIWANIVVYVTVEFPITRLKRCSFIYFVRSSNLSLLFNEFHVLMGFDWWTDCISLPFN